MGIGLYTKDASAMDAVTCKRMLEQNKKIKDDQQYYGVMNFRTGMHDETFNHLPGDYRVRSPQPLSSLNLCKELGEGLDVVAHSLLFSVVGAAILIAGSVLCCVSCCCM